MTTYTTKSGDTWDAMAKELYGSEMKADALMKANLAYITTYKFDSGVELEVPELSEEVVSNDSLPPWKR